MSDADRWIPFLPPHLLECLGARTDQTLPWVEPLEAALLFSDVSGFTALTERLQDRGREGAEEVVRILRVAFAPAIEAITEEGGSIVTFGGDALFVVFLGPGRREAALRGAERVRDSFARGGVIETSVGPVHLTLTQALHWGTVKGVHLGRPGHRVHVVMGRPVSTLARLEGRAAPGEILQSRAFRQARDDAKPLPRRAGSPSLGGGVDYVPPHVRSARLPFEGEYRPVAILFLETRGSALGGLQRFVTRLMRVLGEYGGTLISPDLSSVGVRWLCAFGAPKAHEDDPDRAAQAALALLSQCPGTMDLRGGLHAGTVAYIQVGTASRASLEVMGDVTNTAARVMAKADWSEIWVTEPTRRLLSSVDTRSRGGYRVKGKARPLSLHALLGRPRERRAIRVSAPMIGREAELGRLEAALESALAGRGSVVAIRGDAGVGKSRLKYEAARLARQRDVRVHEGRSVSVGASPYGTVASLIKDALRLPAVPGRQEVVAALDDVMSRFRLEPVDRTHLAEILGAADPAAPSVAPVVARMNSLIAVTRLMRCLADEAPRVLVLEDMHWADPLSVDVAARLAEEVGSMRTLLLLLFRPGYVPPADAAVIRLGELEGEEVGRLLGAHLGEVPPEVRRSVEARAGGNPFYVEELARHLLDRGILTRTDDGLILAREVVPDDLPAGVESLIAARLDDLPSEAKSVAQLGAVVGRTFHFQLLARLVGEPAVATEGVAELLRREILFVKAEKPHLEYIFKHALTRDVAYASILSRRRRGLHRQVADAIEELFSEQRDSFLVLLGHHRLQAGQRRQARESFRSGARLAARRYGNEEAIGLLRECLALVERPDADSVEARSAMGLLLETVGRLGEAETETRRALDDALEHGISDALSYLHGRLSLVVAAAGRIDEADALHDRELELARASDDERGEAIGLANLASHYCQTGRVDRAGSLLERALGLIRKLGARERVAEGAMMGTLANLYRIQGRIEESRDLYRASLQIARDTGNVVLECQAALSLGGLHLDRAELDEARRFYELGYSLSEAVSDRTLQLVALIDLALIHRREGLFERSERELRRGVEASREMRKPRLEGILRGRLAIVVLMARRDLEAARQEAEEAERLLASSGDRFEEGKVVCAWGHIEIAAGRSGARHLERAVGMCHEHGLGSDSELGLAIDVLRRAQAAWENGDSLRAGYLADDLTQNEIESIAG